MINSKKFKKAELDALLTELHILKLQKQTCRPISLPENLTASEFNWLVDFLKKQRMKFMETPTVDVEPIKELNLIEPTQSEALKIIN